MNGADDNTNDSYSDHSIMGSPREDHMILSFSPTKFSGKSTTSRFLAYFLVCLKSLMAVLSVQVRVLCQNTGPRSVTS